MAKLEAQAKASAGAAGAVLIGTAVCMGGALLAAVAMWRKHGRPDKAAAERQLQLGQMARAQAIDEGVIGDTVRAIGSTAKATIVEHEGLHNLAAGLKQGRVFRHEHRSADSADPLPR